MFPNPKNGKAAYLDGCILGALGLKRQGVNADDICFVTPDIKLDDRMKLLYATPDLMHETGLTMGKYIRNVLSYFSV